MKQVRARCNPLIIRLSIVSVVVLIGIFLWQPAIGAPGHGGVLRIGMTAADIPYTAGQPDQGGEGLRFIGYQMYDALINWDLTQGDRLPDLVPGLAERWEVRADDPTKWIFYLRQGVKFHDGTEFNADAVIWNLEKVKNKDAPQYDPKEPFSAFTRFFHSDSAPPKSLNLPPYVNPEVDRLIEQSELTFDPQERDRLLARVNEIIMDDAPWIFIVHDLNPRALSPNVKGFVQAQSWYQDFTLPWVAK